MNGEGIDGMKRGLGAKLTPTYDLAIISLSSVPSSLGIIWE